MKKRLMLLLLFLVVLSAAVIADHGDLDYHPAEGVVSDSVFLLKMVAILLGIGTFIILPVKKHLDETGKKIVFWTLSILVMGSTLYFAGSIVYENLVSTTGGPIHWHADYQVWHCGERVDLTDPSFPKNKIGTPLFHEHDDDRIHIEGTVLQLSDVDFGEYFGVVGGVLEEGHLKYPGKEEVIDVRDGDKCPGGNTGYVQVYVNGQRIENYEDYKIYPDPYVPPGDCIIVEFDGDVSETTDKICASSKAKGWNYDNFNRRRVEVGGVTWQ